MAFTEAELVAAAFCTGGGTGIIGMALCTAACMTAVDRACLIQKTAPVMSRAMTTIVTGIAQNLCVEVFMALLGDDDRQIQFGIADHFDVHGRRADGDLIDARIMVDHACADRMRSEDDRAASGYADRVLA